MKKYVFVFFVQFEIRFAFAMDKNALILLSSATLLDASQYFHIGIQNVTISASY